MGKVNLALNAKRSTFIAGDYRLGCSPMATQSHARNPLAAKLHHPNSSMPTPKRPLEPVRVEVVIPRHPAGILLPAVWHQQDEGGAFKRSLPDTTFRRRLAAGTHPPGVMLDAMNKRCFTNRKVVYHEPTPH